MYSVRKTRSLSICLIMLISALAPMAAPVSASQQMTSPLTLEVNENGTWVEVPGFTDPMTDGVGEAGTFEFRFTSMNLTLNDSYSLEWAVEVCEMHDDCTEDYEHRNWSAMNSTSTELWNLTVDIMDCDISIYASLYNHSSAEGWDMSWNLFGPCGNNGDITLVMDTDGDGVDESIEGFDFDLDIDLAPGSYNASFEIANLVSTGEYIFEWEVGFDTDEGGWMGESAWNGTDPGSLLDFSLVIMPWTCNIWIEAILAEEDAAGDYEAISAFVQILSGPCDSPIEVSIWDNSSGEWMEIHFAHSDSEYEECAWSDEDTRWWCGEDYDGDGEIDEYEDWWYYCEWSEDALLWFCTDSFGQSEDHEFTENNSLLSPMMLEEGTYDVRVNLTWLNDSTHYGMHMFGMSPYWVEFNATSDNYTIMAELEVDAHQCHFEFGVAVWEDPDNTYPNSMPLMQAMRGMHGPCEEFESPFVLTYDGVEWEPDWEYTEWEDCTDDGEGWECYEYQDCDGDGQDDEDCYYSEWFEDGQCSWSDGDMVWYCEVEVANPFLEGGNHTMELTVESLDNGSNYTLDIWTEMCRNMMGCGNWDWLTLDFQATSEEISEIFYLETDNFTCNMNIRVELHQNHEDYWGHHDSHVYSEDFGFHGPCEQPPSPLSLTHNGSEYEMDFTTLNYDFCEEEYSNEYRCWYEEWDFEGDGYPEYTQHPDDCDVDDDGGWVCESFEKAPDIDSGNNTMELTVEDLEIGTDYSVEISVQVYNLDDYQYYEVDSYFEATSSEITEEFYVEVDEEETCWVEIHVEIYSYENDSNNDMGHDYHETQFWSEHFPFNGPCVSDEHEGGPFTLEYDDGSGAMEWEMVSETHWYEDCWPDWEGMVCLETPENGEWDFHHYDTCEESEGYWGCNEFDRPLIGEGNYSFTWVFEDLEEDEEYVVMWDVCYEHLIGMSWHWDCDEQEMMESFVGTSSGTSEIQFMQMEIGRNLCDLDLGGNLMIAHHYDNDSEWDELEHVGSSEFSFRGPCEVVWAVDIGLEVDDDGWQEIEGFDMMQAMMSEQEGGLELDFLMSNVGYYLEEGNHSMMWTMDGLSANESYMFEFSTEFYSLYGGQIFFCGDGEGIPLGFVNDEVDDCDDGSDEQQYDDDGDPINWFECDDGSTVWIEQVNDGDEDCPNGEDEEEPVGMSHEEILVGSSENEMMEWDMEVPEFCLGLVQGAMISMDDGTMVGMYMAHLFGSETSSDENGNEIPDCIEMIIGDGDDHDGDVGFRLEDFTEEREYLAQLESVDLANGTAVVFISAQNVLSESIREKIDHDFFDGDGSLNETEAYEFEQMVVMSMPTTECAGDDDFPNFTMNGVETWCASSVSWFNSLANGSSDRPSMVQGWYLHYNVSLDDSGQMTLLWPATEETEPEGWNATLCGGVLDETGMVVVSWFYNGTAVASDCIEVMAGETIQSVEVIFGTMDSDGDGYNDFDDRFPEDPSEWNDTDDDGWGDNSDDFPNDASEHSDSDNDGVGDNADAFPYDPSETADSDGDGTGDNADAFPDDASETTDTDGDGVGDNADTDMDGDGTDDSIDDSDGDGVNDDVDAFPNDANESTDSDGDGVGDNADAFPDDSNESADTDGDGIGDNADDDIDGDGVDNDFDDFPMNGQESTDTDGDGVGDQEDAFPNDPSETSDNDEDGIGDNADTDDDNDGTLDVSDAFPLDASEDTDTDMDGVGNNADAFDNDPGEWLDSDGDGVGDNSDAFPSDPRESADTDGDGVGDNTDAFVNDPNEIMDSDGDGIGNNADAFPYNSNEQKDTDGDGIGDNADDDADGDGVIDDPSDIPDEEDDDGGFLGVPGFSAATGVVSILGAAILIAGRRKD